MILLLLFKKQLRRYYIKKAKLRLKSLKISMEEKKILLLLLVGLQQIKKLEKF